MQYNPYLILRFGQYGANRQIPIILMLLYIYSERKKLTQRFFAAAVPLCIPETVVCGRQVFNEQDTTNVIRQLYLYLDSCGECLTS